MSCLPFVLASANKQAIADAENVLKQNANKQQVDQALQNILNAKQALTGFSALASSTICWI
jgi:hypothetical protein